MPFNGPALELPEEGPNAATALHNSPMVYCTECGNVYVSSPPERSCPTCTLAEMIEDVEMRLEQLDRDIGVVDSGAI